MSDIHIAELRGLIKNLKSTTASGYDKISNLSMKHLTRRPLLHLLSIFKNCIKYNYFPEIWKTAKIIILHKPGKDPSVPDNLRPISSLPALSKLLERNIFSK